MSKIQQILLRVDLRSIYRGNCPDDLHHYRISIFLIKNGNGEQIYYVSEKNFEQRLLFV